MENAEIINLTPHPIRVLGDDGREILVVPPSGEVASVSTVTEPAGTVNGVPVVRTRFGEVQGLPEPQPGRVYIVSALVLQALGGSREDVLAPDTGQQ